MSMDNIILEVKDLAVKFKMNEGDVYAVNGVNYILPEGKSIGIVGESGCGKTVSSYALNRLLPNYANLSGQILLKSGMVRLLTLSSLNQKERKLGGFVEKIFL